MTSRDICGYHRSVGGRVAAGIQREEAKDAAKHLLRTGQPAQEGIQPEGLQHPG